jgi:nucleoside-diphosphate-sugar epimerase
VTSAGGIEGIVLRYGGFYGPGTSMDVDPDGEQTAMLRARKLPIVGDGGGVWSFVHVEDASEAAVVMMTEIRGASNLKAKRELGWQPRHKSLWESLAG